MHRAHDVRMRIERAAREADVGRTVLAIAAHQLSATAQHTHRQSAAQALAISDQIGFHAEICLRAVGTQTEAHHHLVHDQHDAAARADLAQFLQPCRVRRVVEMRAARAIDQRRIRRRGTVRMQCLQRIHQHAGDVIARCQHAQRQVVHVG